MNITKGKADFRLLICIFIIIMSIFISFKNYIFFHFILEIFCVVIASTIAIFGNSSYSINSNSLASYIGTAYVFVAIIDFLHALSYKGINIISTGSNIPTQLWVLGRYIEAFSFLIAFVWWNKKFDYVKVMTVYFIITLISVNSIFFTNLFPNCYIEGAGLTKFKIISEYLIIAVCFINIILIYKNKKKLQKSITKLLIDGCIFVALAEGFFTLYVDVYGIFNALGHICKAISYVYICKAIFFENIEEPFKKTISRYNEELEKNLDLSFNMCIDFMTGLYNRRYLDSVINSIIINNVEKIVLIVFDMNNLKKINDNFGHIKGDEAILETINVLKQNFGSKDVLVRTGGDEFLTIVFDGDDDNIKMKLDSIGEDLKKCEKIIGIPLSIAYGVVAYKGKISKDVFEKLFKEADEAMYKNKAMRKKKLQF